MSWLGVKYALACRDTRVKGGARMVLVSVGARIEYRRITSSPTSLSELQWLSLMSVEQVRRNLDLLEGFGKVRRLSRGKNAIYALPEMAGPLFVVDDGDPVKMTDFVLDCLPEEIGQNARKVAGRMPGFRRRMTDFSGRRAGGLLFSEVRTSKVPTTTEEAGAAAEDALIEFLLTEYPKQRRGVRYRIPTSQRDAARSAARELLAGRSLDAAQAIIVAGLQDTADPWLNDRNNDRGIFAILHKLTYLEGVVLASASHPQPSVWDDLRARLEVKLTRHAFHIWVNPLALIEDRGLVIVLSVPDDLHREWLNKHFSGALEEAITEVRPGAALVFRVREQEATG